jgi:hypothetical protein
LRVAAVDKRHKYRFLHQFIDLSHSRVQLLRCRRKVTNFQVEYWVSHFRRQVDFSRAIGLDVRVDQSGPEKLYVIPVLFWGCLPIFSF